jgi:hypothetical protein
MVTGRQRPAITVITAVTTAPHNARMAILYASWTIAKAPRVMSNPLTTPASYSNAKMDSGAIMINALMATIPNSGAKTNASRNAMTDVTVVW